MKRVLIFFVLLFHCLLLIAEQRMVVRIPKPDNESLRTMLLKDMDIAAYVPNEYLDIVIKEEELPQFIEQYPDLSITQREQELKNNLNRQNRDLPGYRDYQSIVNELMMFEALHPSLVQVSTIGTGWGEIYSSQNLSAYQDFMHQIYAVKISNNVHLNEDEPAYYFVGGHHAREPLSVEVCMAIMQYLLDGYGTDVELTQLIDTSEIWIIPLLNPDGHKLVIDQTDVWWRKNIRDNNTNFALSITGSGYGYGIDGVDLNRNYSFMRGNLNASDDPNSVTYHGLYGFSEPETTAFKGLLDSGKFVAGISFHTYGEYVLYPFGYAHNVSGPDVAEQTLLAQQMAQLIPKQDVGTYTAMPSYSLYPVSGTSEDWAYGTHGIFAYTIEMATTFIPPAAEVPVICQNHLAAAKHFLQRKNFKTLTGHVYDANTLEPISAMVWISEIDGALVFRSPYVSRADFGSYYRFLPEGIFTAKFVLEGYQTQTHVVEINSLGQTVLDVYLIPSVEAAQHIRVSDYNGVPLQGAQVSFVGGESYFTDDNGWVLIPSIALGEYRAEISKSGYETLYVFSNFNGFDIYYRLSSVAIFSEGFENDLSNWVRTGAWAITQSESIEGTRSLTDSPAGNYSSNLDTYCRTLNMIDLQNVERANLQFWARHSLAADGDYVALQYSLNGASLNTIHVFSGTSPWTHYSLNLNGLVGQSVFLYFRIVTTSGGGGEGIFIDGIRLYTSSYSSDIDEGIVAPVEFITYPNPFKNEVTFSLKGLQLPKLQVDIFNIRGQKVRTIDMPIDFSEDRSQVWDGTDFHGKSVSNGVYLCRVKSSGSIISTSKIMRIK